MSENGTSIAVIALRSGAICQLLVNDFEIIPKFALEDSSKFVFGSLLAPWPNRLEDGSYSHQGKNFAFGDLDKDDNKNHGLLLERDLEVREHSESSLRLGYKFGSDASYPFEIDLEVCYHLESTGLVVTAVATNLGADAPFAIGFHPYFLTGDEFELSAEFSKEILANERLLPTGEQEITGLHLDESSPQLATLDTCFKGASEVEIRRPHGSFVVRTLESLPFFMLYRPQDQIFESGSALAIEPMSAAANVFQSDIESVILGANTAKSFSFEIKTQ